MKSMTNEEVIKRLDTLRRENPFLLMQDVAALDLAIAALERDRWISVRERAPAHGETVIVTDGEIVCDALFGGFTQVTKSLYFEPSESIEHITHWMPLPEPPKEET